MYILGVEAAGIMLQLVAVLEIYAAMVQAFENHLIYRRNLIFEQPGDSIETVIISLHLLLGMLHRRTFETCKQINPCRLHHGCKASCSSRRELQGGSVAAVASGQGVISRARWYLQ